MWIIGCDYHPRFQQIAFVNTEGGEYGQRRLEHVGEAEQFYRSLAGADVRVGMEASGHARWFERLRSELRRRESRRLTPAMPSTCCGCCAKGGSKECGSGYPRPRTGTCGS